MTTALHSVPAPAGVEDDRVSALEARVSGEIVAFAHLARLSVPLTDLDAEAKDDLRRDLAVLVVEATRRRPRPRLLSALLDAVLDDMLPALSGYGAAALREARPRLDVPTDSAS